MNFADLHCHTLWGVDDGSRDEATMHRMVDMAYADGTRILCLTPHFCPALFGDNSEKALEAFAQLQRYTAENYPDLQLYLGSELRFMPSCFSALESGQCRTLNGTDYVLVDFSAGESPKAIIRGLTQLMSMGYTPVLAHAERYRNLTAAQIADLSRDGVWIQVNAASILGNFGLGDCRRAATLLRRRLADLVASDSHSAGTRNPKLSRAYRAVKAFTSVNYANALFRDNPCRLLGSSLPGAESTVKPERGTDYEPNHTET